MYFRSDTRKLLSPKKRRADPRGVHAATVFDAFNITDRHSGVNELSTLQTLENKFFTTVGLIINSIPKLTARFRVSPSPSPPLPRNPTANNSRLVAATFNGHLGLTYEQTLSTVDTQGLDTRDEEDCSPALTRVARERLKKTCRDRATKSASRGLHHEEMRPVRLSMTSS